MKKFLKRVLALLCMLTMIVSGIVIIDDTSVNASDTGAKENEYYIVNESTQITKENWSKSDCNLDLSGCKEKYLMLYITFNLSDKMYTQMVSNTYQLYIEVAKSKADYYEFSKNYTLNGNTLKEGENTIKVKWSDFSKTKGEKGVPTLNEPLNWFRIYALDKNWSSAVSLAGLEISEIKVVDTENYLIYEERNTSGTSEWVRITDANVDMKKAGDVSNLMLYIELYIADDTAKGNARNVGINVDIGNSTENYMRKYISTNDYISQVGTNMIVLRVSDLTTKGNGLSVDETITYFRMGDASKTNQDAIIKSVWLVDISAPKEWTVLSNTTIDAGQTWSKNDCNVLLGRKDEDISNLLLYIRLNLTEDVYNTLKANAVKFQIEIAKEKHDYYEYQWTVPFDDISLKQGENIIAIKWDTWASPNNHGTIPTIETTLKYFRFFTNNASGGAPEETIRGIILEEVKIVDVSPYVETYATGAVAGTEPRTLGLDVSDVPENYIFAGWYTDKECATALSGSANGTAYAKFVSGDVLDIKAQIRQETANTEIYTFDAAADETSGNINSSHSLAFTHAEGEVKAGTHGLKGTGTGNNWVEFTMKNSVDISNATGFSFWLYISDPNLITGETKGENMRIQFGNFGGAYYNINLKGYTFEKGWNKICLEFASSGVTGGTLDKTVVNWFRILQNGGQSSDLTYIVDELCVFKDTADIRFVTTVDSLFYREVGFDITINETTLTKPSNTVYSKLYAVGTTSGETISYQPYFIAPQSLYFDTYTIGSIPSSGYNEPITVQSYWITQDGTKVYGTEPRTLTIAQVIAANN